MTEAEGLDAVRRHGPADPDLLVPVGSEDIAVVGTHGLHTDRPAGEGDQSWPPDPHPQDLSLALHGATAVSRCPFQRNSSLPPAPRPTASSTCSPSSPSSFKCPCGQPVTKSWGFFLQEPLPYCPCLSDRVPPQLQLPLAAPSPHQASRGNSSWLRGWKDTEMRPVKHEDKLRP